MIIYFTLLIGKEEKCILLYPKFQTTEEENYTLPDKSQTNMIFQTLALWGCIPEITRDCVDMTNASSTYLSIALGAIVGGLISWWVYKIQKKTSAKQDETLRRINDLEESHDRILKSIQRFQQHQEGILKKVLSLEGKIDAMIESNKPS
jgi:hypothetical protein